MSCGATCGITKVRERERSAAVEAARRAYPDFVWRARTEDPRGAARPLDALTELAALGRTIEELLPVRALLRAGEAGECDALYLLAGVHAPSLFEIDRDGGATAPPPHDRETYVRISVSALGRYVTLQEVMMTASRVDGESIAIEEERVIGVDDRRLQHIVKGLQGALKKARWVVLDMAFLVQDAPGGAPQHDFEALYGCAPSMWSFLFEPTPAATTRIAIASSRSDVEPAASA